MPKNSPHSKMLFKKKIERLHLMRPVREGSNARQEGMKEQARRGRGKEGKGWEKKGEVQVWIMQVKQ
jgi:hypothetical protein